MKKVYMTYPLLTDMCTVDKEFNIKVTEGVPENHIIVDVYPDNNGIYIYFAEPNEMAEDGNIEKCMLSYE